MGQVYRWINPDGKSKKKGGTKIQVRVIEYIIDTDEGLQNNLPILDTLIQHETSCDALQIP